MNRAPIGCCGRNRTTTKKFGVFRIACRLSKRDTTATEKVSFDALSNDRVRFVRLIDDFLEAAMRDNREIVDPEERLQFRSSPIQPIFFMSNYYCIAIRPSRHVRCDLATRFCLSNPGNIFVCFWKYAMLQENQSSPERRLGWSKRGSGFYVLVDPDNDRLINNGGRPCSASTG